MLVLGEFSVSELADLSGVKEPTVRTILRREGEYAEQVASVPTGRRGGQPNRWRLRPGATERIRSELEQLESVGVGPWLGDRPSDSQSIPAGIVAAEHVLLRLVPGAAEPGERARLVGLAQLQLDEANATMSTTPAHASLRTGQHKRVVELLLELELAGQFTGEYRPAQAGREVRDIMAELRLVEGETDDDSLRQALRTRLASAAQPAGANSAWMMLAGSFGEAVVRHSRHNLPVEPNKFVGRQRELADLTATLSGAHMLTLRGPGGIGKTRLAHSLASEVVAEFPDGAWLVGLADAVEPDPVARLVAGAMGIEEEPGRMAADTLADALRSRRLLLILDSCESFVDASADLVGKLLRTCPEVWVLATSREPLGLKEEIIWDVPPLSVPHRHPSSAIDLFQSEAMRLFAERALDAMPGFALDGPTINTVAQLCRALEGMPLGIELAAARVGALSVEQIETRLTEKVQSTVPADHAATGPGALMAAVDWTYEMLSEPEQILLRRLSVFAGWSLRMAEEVCQDDDIPGGKISALLADLVDKSLVTLDHEEADEARYGMLDTIRDYAKDRLAASGEQLRISIRLRNYLLSMVEETVSAEFGSDGPTWHDRVAKYRRSFAERDNCAAALSLSLEQGEATAGLRLCSALRGLWIVRGKVAEGADWFDRFLALDGDAAPQIRAPALVMRAELAFEQQDYQTATECAQAGLDLCRDSGMTPPAGALRVLALVGLRTGRLDAALEQAKTAVMAAQAAADDWEEGLALSSAAAILTRQGLLDEAQRSYEQALDVLRANNGWGVAQTLFGLGELARTRHDHESASRYFAKALDLYRDIDARPEISRCLAGRGWVALDAGDLDMASSCLSESLELNVAMGQRLAIARGLEAFAVLALRRGHPAHAVQLQGAALELREALGHAPSERGRERIDDLLEHARGRLGSTAVDGLIAEGRALTPQQAAKLAMAEGGSQPRLTPESGPAALTSAEYQIATLIGRGLSTRAIAAELFISPASVGRHVANLLAKLDLESRAQIARWVETDPSTLPVDVGTAP
jgi:predicted ATPase/DNA-binding CsgD family transcriptional regulator